MYDINVIGNAPVDMLTHVPESLISEHNLNKGDFNQVDSATFDAITQQCTVEEMQSGGSCANSAWALAKMGKNVHFTGHIGNDAAGQHFYTDMEAVGITMPAPQQGSRTMEIYVLITPDGERTFVSQGALGMILGYMLFFLGVWQLGSGVIIGIVLRDGKRAEYFFASIAYLVSINIFGRMPPTSK